MDEDTVKSNINTLKEMILDEEKLVTYVSLSKELCVHVNESKYLLRRFVEDMRATESDLDLNINYIISGLAHDNIARTVVSSEKELDKIRNGFQILFFEHIYSISKGSSNTDNVALLAVSKFDDISLCMGLIKSSLCVKRSTEEIGSLKSNSQVNVQSEVKTSIPLVKKVKEEPIKKDISDKIVKKPQETKSEPNIKTEVMSPKKETSKAKLEIKKNGVKSQKGIAGFFSKSNSAPSKTFQKLTNEEKKEDLSNQKESPTDNKNNEEEEMEVDVAETKPIKEIKGQKSDNKPIKVQTEKIPIKEIKESKSEKEQANGKSNRKSGDKLTQIKKNAKVDKKRKRVLHVSDSDSEEDKDPFADEMEDKDDINNSDDEIPPTPTVNTVKITSGIVNPKKRRKIVDKTYTDEEGYILTKKVEVYESCSDGEEEVPKENIKVPEVNQVKVEKQETSPKKTASPKKNGSKVSKKKISPPQKGKQATLMSFFKKA